MQNIDNDHPARLIPQPPSSTMQTSNEPPRTLWMGDLDPAFDESSIQQIWAALGKSVSVKLIRAKKNLLIPCSTSSTFNAGEDASTAQLTDPQKININGVSFIDPNTTQLHHAGYCFVEFQKLEDAQWALTLNSTPLPNILSNSTHSQTNPTLQRSFRLNWASGATLQSAIPSTPEFSLFVGDLSPSATEAHLLSLFQKNFKSVKTVRVMTDPITGASRCFGFVRFADEHERRRALVEMNGVWCQGRCLRVAYATPRNNMLWQMTQNPNQSSTVAATNTSPPPPPPTAAPLSSSSSSSSSSSHHPHPHPHPHPHQKTSLLIDTANVLVSNNMISIPMLSQSSSQSASSIPTSIPKNSYTNPKNTTVFIGGLASQISEPQLYSLFLPFGSITNVRIPQGKGCGFVKFESRIDAEAAIQGMQGFIVGGNPIRLSWGRSSGEKTPTQQHMWNTGTSYNATAFVPHSIQQARQNSGKSNTIVPPVHPSLLQ